MQDPTLKEMRRHLGEAFAGLVDFDEAEVDREAAIYWFAADYHGGQSSRLYEALCASQYRPGPMCNGPEKDSAEAMMYSELESEFAIGG